MSNGRAVYARCSRWYRAVYAYEMSDVEYINMIKVVLFKVTNGRHRQDAVDGIEQYIQCLAKVFGPLELCDLLPHFRLQT